MADNYKIVCNDCNAVYKPLTKDAAINGAVAHCDRRLHMDVHALPADNATMIIYPGDDHPDVIGHA